MFYGAEPLETKRVTQSIGNEPGTFLQLSSGSVLANRYQIQDVIGIGGMGSVYRARDLHFPNVVKLVAVKEMINKAPDPQAREAAVKNFEREANILVTLNHPAIPRIFDFFTHEDRSYLVLELINGKDLEAILRNTIDPVPEEQAILWAIEICDVLEYLHTHKPEPIIFRDVKPQNLMINQHNHIVVVDFGIAKVFSSTQKGTMIGTEGYSPPEQYRGEASFRTDIYALGATLHHLLTRRDPRLEAPFSFADRPIRKSNPNVSPELEAVINTCLSYKPEDRFADMHSLKEALIFVAQKSGIDSKINSVELITRDQSVKPLWSFKCEDEIRGSATFDNGMVFIGACDHNLYALDGARGSFIWKFACENAILTKPVIENNQVFFGSDDGCLYALQAKSGKKSWSINTEGAIRSSPKVDAGLILFGSDDGNLYSINIATMNQAWTYRSEGSIRSTPYLMNDLVYFGSESNEFICIDLRGQMRWRFWAKRANTSSPVVSDGIVYFTSQDSNCYALDAKSGWVIWKFRMGKGSVSSPAILNHLLYAGSADGILYCIDKTSAKEIWRFKADHQISGSPLVYKEYVYFGTADGKFYCLDAKTGRQRWRFVTGGPITGLPIAMNDMIYFGSSDHYLYALMA